ncbi:unnamed protein product [Ambrosiozyma monospora]|uniref:Unnamed protein product n=1 Tax=Ambrosiozyma monospora TaxID=43982 RepID=A0ACB5SXP4_AMBMO|nr:unnamed protein product [Ambrosiozyma monospora]
MYSEWHFDFVYLCVLKGWESILHEWFKQNGSNIRNQHLELTNVKFSWINRAGAEAWKIYDLYLIKNDTLRELLSSGTSSGIVSPEFNFVLKYLFLDGLIIWFTTILNIPKLSFSTSTNLLALVLLFSSTILLTADLKLPLLTIFTTIWKTLFPDKEMAITERYVDTESLLDQSSHFKGKKIIRFAPDSSIKLNPFGDNFCFNPDTSYKIEIPIRVESLNGLDYLQISHRGLNNDNTILNYTRKDFNKFFVSDYSEFAKLDEEFDEDKIKYLQLPITKPGSYAIHSALDKKVKNIRSYRSDLVIPMCPEAKFVLSEPITDKCIDDELDSLAISVIGVPPFTLFYEEEINGALSYLPQSVIVPDEDNFQSPLLSKTMYSGKSQNKKKYYQSSDLKDISWAKTRVINVPVGKRRIEKFGEYIYTINKVIDGFGNTVEYTPSPSDKSSFVKFNSHPLPMISIIDPRPKTPILIGQRKSIDVKLLQVPCVECEAPYTVIFKHTPPDNSSAVETFSRTFDFKTPARIEVDKPGVYSIETAASKYCSGKIGSSSVNILEAKLPQIKISADPIIDNCVGTTGFKFDFDFVGNAPFEVAYKVSVLDPNDPTRILSTKQVKSLRSESTVLEFDYKPPSEGSYAIEFISLSDKYYKNQRITNKDYRYVTYFKQRPKAYFSKNSNIKRINVCNGDDAEVMLTLEGKAPFKFSYDLVSPSYEVKTFNFDNVYDHEFKIKTDALTKGGDYVLTLRDVTDASNCGVDFKAQEVHFEVKKDVPQLSFVKANEYTIVQGKRLLVPLRAESSELVDLKYKYRSLDGSVEHVKQLSLFNPTEGFPVFDEGYYNLLEFRQGGCPEFLLRTHCVRIHQALLISKHLVFHLSSFSTLSNIHQVESRIRLN